MLTAKVLNKLKYGQKKLIIGGSTIKNPIINHIRILKPCLEFLNDETAQTKHEYNMVFFIAIQEMHRPAVFKSIF